MFVANDGSVAALYNEEGITSSGSLVRSLRKPGALSEKRKIQESAIIGISEQTNTPIGIVVNKVLSESIPELQNYVLARGESPAKDLPSLAVQSALLRASEIALTAKAIDTTNQDALEIIENAEQQHVEDNSGEANTILAPDTAAALNMLVYRIASRYKERGGSGWLPDFVTDMKAASGASNFDTLSYRSVANNADDGFIFYTPDQEQEVTGGVTQVPNGPTASSGSDFWTNLFGSIDKIVDGITKVTTAVNTTTGNVQSASGGILGAVTNVGSDIGAASIQKYVADNWLKIVGVILAIILITILVTRVGRR